MERRREVFGELGGEVVRLVPRQPLPEGLEGGFDRAFGLISALQLPDLRYPLDAPWLPTLLTGLEMMTSYVDERFLSEQLEKAPAPVPFESFRAALQEDGEEHPDRWLPRFLETQRYMWDLARIKEPPSPEESYGRYKEWLPFAHRNRAFFEASAKDLGYELQELDRSPGERLF